MSGISPEEQHARIELAALYRAFVRFGWTDLTYTHLSARVPGEPECYLINPYGLLFEEVTASNLVKLDFTGRVRSGDHPYNRAGHLIHSFVLAARRDLGFVLHSHTPATVAVSAMECGLLPLSQHANVVLGTIGYHRYSVAEENETERARLVADLGERFLLLMNNHGLLACGRNAGEAFLYHYFAERACVTQVDALRAGVPLITPASAVASELSAWGAPRKKPWGGTQWAALLRVLEREDDSFKR